MFERLLIANRGEIACRIVRTARRMGIRSIAVYSEADAGARHVREADEAILIGPSPAVESYLAIERVIDAAQRSGAQAIHPGYGFLSENSAFAEACAESGLVFVGPPAAAIRAMGSKSGAKSLMEKAGVPLVPGYHGDEQDPPLLAREAKRIGFPILIKPSAGGGGKGMHVVESADGFEHALERARREAKSAFGDDHVLIERYLQRPRHIEVQIFGDVHGNYVHLFARDCSVQRRHQKVIEEAPAPGVGETEMRLMGEAAIAAARAVNYVGAGTIEFIAEGGTFYFMEMNTRLQVEHPVTEMVTGLDLVEWQLRIAAGEALPLRQDQIDCRGHAVEARVYAEDPRRGFLPSTGKLIHVDLPDDGPGVRVDSGVETGDAISVYYDPMLAKVIAWGDDRRTALQRLAAALEEGTIVGVDNNLPFLAAILRHPEFGAGPVDTGFIGRHQDALTAPPAPADDLAFAFAALAIIADDKAKAASKVRPSPWAIADGWQLLGVAMERLTFQDGDREVELAVRHLRDGGHEIVAPGGVLRARIIERRDTTLVAVVDGHRLTATVVHAGNGVWVRGTHGSAALRRIDPYDGGATEAAGAGRLASPMPGTVVSIAVKVGDKVTRGAPLVVIEAMKMEHAIAAPAEGTITAVRFSLGDKVDEGVEIIGFEASTEAAG